MRKTSLQIQESEIVQTVTLTELCRSCNVSADWVMDLIDHGILEPVSGNGTKWKFESSSLTRAACALRLNLDLDVNLSGIAVVLDLLEERDRLARKVARFESGSDAAQ